MEPGVRPFSNGTQFADWTGWNCDLCRKGENPDAIPDCDIALALGEGYWGDGTVTPEIARRMGYYEAHAEGEYPAYNWRCPEKGAQG